MSPPRQLPHDLGAVVAIRQDPARACAEAITRSPAGPSAPTEDFSEPATHRAPLPGGGEIALRFVAFHPARGARLIPDKGAYVSVHFEMPRRAVLVSAAGDAWDGTKPIATSFMSSNILFALPVCPDSLGRIW